MFDKVGSDRFNILYIVIYYLFLYFEVSEEDRCEEDITELIIGDDDEDGGILDIVD